MRSRSSVATGRPFRQSAELASEEKPSPAYCFPSSEPSVDRKLLQPAIAEIELKQVWATREAQAPLMLPACSAGAYGLIATAVGQVPPLSPAVGSCRHGGALSPARMFDRLAACPQSLPLGMHFLLHGRRFGHLLFTSSSVSESGRHLRADVLRANKPRLQICGRTRVRIECLIAERQVNRTVCGA